MTLQSGPWTFGWDALGVIATFVAVIVALFVGLLQSLREWQRRPQLLISHDLYEDVVRMKSDHVDLAIFRLRITAVPKRNTATGVEVFLSNVSEAIAKPIHALLPAGGQALRVPHSSRTVQAVPSGASRWVDLVELRRTSGQQTAAQLVLPGAPVNLLPGKHVRLNLEVAGSNVEARSFVCEVSWSGGELQPLGFPQEVLEVTLQ